MRMSEPVQVDAPSAIKSCRVCQHSGCATTYVAREMMYGTRETFSYFQCQSCGCLQIDQIPTDLVRHYPNNYYSFSSNESTAKEAGALRRSLMEWRLRPEVFGWGFKLAKLAGHFVDRPANFSEISRFLGQIPKPNKELKFLDVGCGAQSWWLSGLRLAGFTHLIGIDPNIETSQHLQCKNIIKGSIESLTSKFDVITFHHSLEHIPGQHETLKQVTRLLNPDGICIVRIPLVDSEAWEHYGINWVELDAPRHLYLHSERSFEKLCEACGLRIAKSFREGTDFEFWGSEQYQDDVHLTSPDSYWINKRSKRFSGADLARFSEMAKRANETGRGGRGAFILRVK